MLRWRKKSESVTDNKGELEVVWVPEESLEAFGATAVGWWAIGDGETAQFGPCTTLDECVRAVLAEGYAVPKWQKLDSK